MTIRTAAEFIALRNSQVREEYMRAAYDEAPIEVWWQVIEEDPDMRFWVAQNKTVPLEVLQFLADDRDPRVRDMVAMKGKLDSSTLARLATDENDAVRMSVARHRRTPVEVLRSMLDDQWEDVREMVKARLESLADPGDLPPHKSPKGMEFDNVFLLPDQFEVVPYPCTMHVDAELSSAELTERLAELSNGRAVGNRVDGEFCVFELFAEQPPAPDAGPAPDFVDFRYRIHGEARSNVPVERMAAIVGSILKHFWDVGISAVALCDYRDLLPGNGGLPKESSGR